MAKKPKPDPDPATLNYEDAIGALEEIVERIEGGEIGLAESMEAYERGVELIARCRAVLGEAEQKISELDLGLGDGGSSAAPHRTD